MPNSDYDLFISYRRSDSAGHARALFRDLCRRFEKQRIFFDRESIEAGTVFPERLREGVESCRVLLALIAPGWLETKAAGGGRRIDSEDDFVRKEIASALDLGRKVIPVLFDDVPMPDASQLPDPLRRLTACDALTLRGKNFEYDVQLEELVRLLALIPGMPQPLLPTEGVIVGEGLEFDVYRGTHYIPIRLRAPLRAMFKPLIEDRTHIFAGRRHVFERIMQFAASDEGGYMVITAPAGFGKTALIANLVSATPEAFAYHFFAPVYGEETLDEKFFLQNVLEQMAAWHDYAAELPDAINELRALYQQFVETPLDHSQVLVLDGLDEVSRWKLAPYLSRRLPAHLHVVVTLRDVGQDWLNDYGFPSAQIEPLPLGGLDRTEIQELFAGLGEAGLRIASDDALMNHIVERAAYENDPELGADPFYIRFLAEDVANGKVTADDIPDQPKGLDAYLDNWWKEIVQLAGDEAVRDLFGTLAAAVGPIARTDLETINPKLKDDWAGDFFDQILARVRRVVRQDKDGRYSLAHPRLRRYLADSRRIGKINDYTTRLLEYCSKWTDHNSPYALAFYGTHLHDAGRIDDLYQLFTGEWIAAQWTVLSTYGPLVADFDRAAKAFLQDETPDYSRALALVVARQTGRELMQSFPTELFVAWAGHGEVERSLTCLRMQSKSGGWAVDSLITVAGKLLELHKKGVDDYDDRAAELLILATDQLSLRRSLNLQVESLSQLVTLFPIEHGLPEAARQLLIRQAIESVVQSRDNVFRAAGYGEIASALRGSTPDLDTARDLLGRARESLDSIDLTADRAFVLARALPAIEVFAPGDELLELEKLVQHGSALLDHGTLAQSPCIGLLERWHPWQSTQPERAAPVLLDIAELYLGETGKGYRAAGLSVIVSHLCKIGQVNIALELIDRCMQIDAIEGVHIPIKTIDVMREFVPDRVTGWLEMARELTEPSHHDFHTDREHFTVSVTQAFAATGNWDKALEIAATLDTSQLAETLPKLMKQAEVASGLDAVARGAIMDRIIAAAGELNDVETEERARISAVIAQVLSPSSAARIDAELARAAALCLAHLPEGDNDELRRLQAVALHEDGKSDEVIAVLRQLTWVSNVAAVLAFLIESSTADVVSLSTYTEILIAELNEREGADLYSQALRNVAPAVVQLAQQGVPMAERLGTFVTERLGPPLSIDDQIGIYASIIAAACYFNADPGALQYGKILDEILELRSKGQGVTAPTIAEVIRQIASVSTQLGDRLNPLTQKAQTLANGFAEDDDAIIVRGALCLLLAQRDCQAALSEMEQLVSIIAALAVTPPAVRHIMRMFAEMIGRTVGDNEKQAQAAASLAAAVARYAHHCPAEAAQVLQQVIDQALAIRNEGDRAQALIDIFDKVQDGPKGWPPLFANTLSSALQRAQLHNEDLNHVVLGAAVKALCLSHDPDTAERMVQQISDRALMEDLMLPITFERERLALGELSVFERAFVATSNGELAQSFLHSIKVDNASAGILDELGNSLVTEYQGTSRLQLLSDLLPLLVAPLKTLRGTGEIGRLISEVELFDKAFAKAAHLVGQAAGS